MDHAEWANKDFYKVLGVAKDADAATIKKAYRKLAKDNHPDSRPGDAAAEARFKEVAEAYDVVGDAERRKEYDELREMVAGTGAGFRGGFPGGFGGGGAGAEGFDVSDLFGGLFNGGFGGGTRRGTPRASRGADIETEAALDFTDAVDGTTVELRLASDAACPTCRGSGGKPGTQPHICPECEGSGMVINSMGGGFSVNQTCPSCHGQQLVYDEPCPTCHGSGRGRSTRTVRARIPAGVKDGQRIRLRGKGGTGEHGGPAGDLYVVVHVRTHPVFGRSGDALTLDLPVTFAEAALGAEVKVPTLGGPPVTLRIAPGTPNGRTLRVRGRGVPRKDGTRGDLLVTVDVQVPASLDAEAKQALAAYRDRAAEADPRAGLFAKVGS